MILQCYSVFDNATQAFLPPFYARSKGEAIRAFSAAVTDTQHNFSKSKHDFVLFQVGTFDDIAGRYDQFVAPDRTLSALEVEQL